MERLPYDVLGLVCAYLAPRSARALRCSCAAHAASVVPPEPRPLLTGAILAGKREGAVPPGMLAEAVRSLICDEEFDVVWVQCATSLPQNEPTGTLCAPWLRRLLPTQIAVHDAWAEPESVWRHARGPRVLFAPAWRMETHMAVLAQRSEVAVVRTVQWKWPLAGTLAGSRQYAQWTRVHELLFDHGWQQHRFQASARHARGLGWRVQAPTVTPVPAARPS
jgi:hypothetical protein